MPDRDDIPQKILLENSEVPRRSSSEGGLVRADSDDYARETKQKIGEYFRREIEDGNNQSVAQINNSPELEIFENGDSNSRNSFVSKLSEGQGQGQEARQHFENQSNSTTFDRDVLPGKQGDVNNETEVQASLLLGQINNDPTPIADEVSRRIQENATFSPDKKYVSNLENQDETSPSEEVAGTRSHLLQTNFGIHGPKKLFGELQIEEGVTPTVTIQQLRNLGCQILLEASGEVFIPSDPSDVQQVLAARASAAVVPGVARLGFRVDKNRFGAVQTLKTNTNPNIDRPEVNIDLAQDARGSFGSVNNPFVPFSAVSSGLSSVIAGTILAFTFSEIFILLSEILSSEAGFEEALSSTTNIIDGTPPENSDSIRERRRRLGSYVPKSITTQNPGESFGLSLLGFNNVDLLIDTQFSYKDSLQEGVKVFFGINNNEFLDSTALAAARIAETPGYYNGILRTLTKAVADPLFNIAGNVLDLAKENSGIQAPSPGDVNPLIGPSNDPTNLLGIINIIKESKFLKFMNVLAALGDVSLKVGTNVSDIDAITDTVENRRTGDGEPERTLNPAALHKKNRLSNRVEQQFRGSLAWGANTVRSMFFLNDKITQAESVYSSQTSNFTDLAGNRNVKLTQNRRLSQTEVRLMERELDSYYVPFYFHDLRTNEIIAFHAFLETIADSYDVEYNEAEGYGRIGKIYTYKNTNRNIQVSFKVVSTNPNDFSEMWLKINKLTMMLFPQYTAGRAISFNSQKFIQPFSQIPSSSPVIRLRVGDLIKSNYSDFDLARLFGIGTDSFRLSEQAITQNSQERARLQRGQQLARQQYQNYEFQNGDMFTFARAIEQVGSTVPRSRVNSIIEVIETSNQFTARTQQRRRQNNRQRRNRRRLPAIPVGSRARVVRVEESRTKTYLITFVPPLPGTDGGTQYRINFNNQASGLITPDPISLLERARSNAQQEQQANGGSTNQQITDFNNNESVRNFFSVNDRQGQTGGANPIFKAFESTRGEGLAGVIKNFSFNWDGAVWETDGLNNRAPKWCTIDVTFAPIFDLNPGLDSNGNMIGAPYNIGQILNQLKLSRTREAEMLATLVSDNSSATVSDDGEEGDFNTPNSNVGLV